jgi:hypothetical protein
MPVYEVDSKRQLMRATGIVEDVMVWEGESGSRRRTDRQAVDPATGHPLWDVEVAYGASAFGRQSTITNKVQVPAPAQPQLPVFEPVEFQGLRCEVRVTKSGGFAEYWSASGLVNVPTRASKSAGAQGGGQS